MLIWNRVTESDKKVKKCDYLKVILGHSFLDSKSLWKRPGFMCLTECKGYLLTQHPNSLLTIQCLKGLAHPSQNLLCQASFATIYEGNNIPKQFPTS